MASAAKKLNWFGWLRRPLFLWVKAKISPHAVAEELGIDKSKPICYVVLADSVFDFLVLDEACRQQKLPLPLADNKSLGQQGMSTKWGAAVYLSNAGFIRTYRSTRKEPPSPFLSMLENLRQNADADVQIVPVGIFWGRSAGRDEGSIFRLLFTDDERAGFLQKVFIVAAQGKNAQVSFSKPISLRDLTGQEQSTQEVARKLTRILRVHFRQKRQALLGPGLVSRNRVVESLVRTKAVRHAIEEESRKRNISRHKAEITAKGYVAEIAAEKTPSFIKGAAILLRRLWNWMYSGVEIHGVERLHQIPPDREIIYVPNHRSHLDYLFISYCIYDAGLQTPHIAAGVNLNFWPVGSILRRVGAFYIRRTFGNNRLYSTVFNEYVFFLLQKGFPIKLFPEGGRSRTGKLLPPKTGMLAMLSHAFLRFPERPVMFVPIYVGYDQVAEVKTYRKELGGAKKQSESLGQLAKGTRKILNKTPGRAYMNVGEPIDFCAYLDVAHPGWREDTGSAAEQKPTWLAPVVANVAEEIMTRVNAAVVVGPVSLTAVVLLATRQHAMAEDELKAHIGIFRHMQEIKPYSPYVVLPQETPEKILSIAEQLSGLRRFSHPGGDVIHVMEPEASYMTYYRNNVAHLYALPSLLAFFLQHNDMLTEKEMIEGAMMIYPILRREFFLRWETHEAEEAIRSYIAALEKLGLFCRRQGGMIGRPEVTSFEFSALRNLGLIVGSSVERYSIAVMLLRQYGSGHVFEPADFQKRCLAMAQRIALLTGNIDAELASTQLFKHVLDHLVELKFLQAAGEQGYRIEKALEHAFGVASKLLSVDIRHSMMRTHGVHLIGS